jgi:glycosyltransferase involved in cell wall biosynthesis
VRILFLSQLLPLPLDAGPKIRAYYVLRYLVEAGHDVTVLCFVRPGDRPEDLEALGRYCTAVETVPLRRSRWKDACDGVRSLVSSTPFLIRRDWLPAMDERRRQLMAGRAFDAVHADQLWMAAYVPRERGAALRVLDQHNAVFKVPARLAANQSNPVLRSLLRREADHLAAFERQTMQQFERVVWVTRQDRDAFADGTDRVGAQPVIPIAVDPRVRPRMRRPDPFRVTFLGGLHWPPNAEGVAWFVDEVWPTIARRVPRAVLTVIGKPARTSSLRSRPDARLEVTGYVGDVDRYISETAVFVVPLRTGAGMRVKILDAWCWGLPVVSTTIGAEGLDAVHGEQLLLADTADAFAGHVIRVLADRALAAHVADGGRTAVEQQYDWRTVYQAWDEVYH